MNTTIEISKNYKQTVELTEKLVSKVNDYVNLSIQLFAFPAFKVKLTAQNIVDILMDREDDPILTAVIVPSSFSVNILSLILLKAFSYIQLLLKEKLNGYRL